MPIKTYDLCGGYGRKPDDTDQQVIRHINLDLAAGEWLSLLGANGSGKSTLLRLLSRILKPQGGSVLLDGRDIHSLFPATLARRLALLPQQQTLPDGMTVYQLVCLGRSPHQPWWAWELNRSDRQQVEKALQWTALESYRDRLVTSLSGGERQRAFLALALAQDPKVLLLDEPTTFLDLHYQLQLLELLKSLNQTQSLSIITVLHDINLAARYSDRLALLRQGKLWSVGSPSEILTPATLRDVFEIEAEILQTSVGVQICPVAASSQATPLLKR